MGLEFVLVYYVLPFVVFALAHYFYVKFGVFISREFNVASKIVFWGCYATFGIILIYTNIIWNVENDAVKHSAAKEDRSRYERYDKYYSDKGRLYNKINITGAVDSQLNVEFAVTLTNNQKGCSTPYTISRHGDNRYTNKERIFYPLLKPGPYSIDIYLENYKEDTDCKFNLEDDIEIYVRGDGQKHAFHYAKLAAQTDAKRYRVIGNEVATIVCKEGSLSRKRITECENHIDANSAVFAFGKTEIMRLDFTTEGLISGNTVFERNASPDFLTKALMLAFRKFFIGEIPSFDPR